MFLLTVSLLVFLVLFWFVPGPIIGAYLSQSNAFCHFNIRTLVFGPLSEMYGRRISVLISMLILIFICFSAATATTTNIQTIMITSFCWYHGQLVSYNRRGGLAVSYSLYLYRLSLCNI